MEQKPKAPDYEKELTHRIIGAAIEVHKALGPGLLESAYQICLAREFALRELKFKQEQPITIQYKGAALGCSYRLDFVVDEKVVVELKAVETMLSVHEAQLLTYLKLTGCKVGLLINFNVPVLKDAVVRRVL